MQDEQGYNGWKNHATWCVNLHLSNDEPLYREALARTAQTIADPPHVSEHWDEEQTRRFNVADMLKDWCQEMFEDYFAGIESGSRRMVDEPGLLAQDLIGGYLGDVDWDEIADSWIEQVKDIQVSAP